MNLAHAEAFLVLADELHFGRTAERLHLSQPPVSRLIASLEIGVGGTLFERTSRRVRLTPLGGQLRDQLGPAYEDLLLAFERARAAARQTAGTLRIGITGSSDGPSISRLLEALGAQQPECDVSLQEVTIYDPYAALREGRG